MPVAAETPAEMVEHVCLMTRDPGRWSMTVRDTDALRHVLGRIAGFEQVTYQALLQAFDDRDAARREVVQVTAERDVARRARERCGEYYSTRWERLLQWARESLPEELRHQFFNIVANGTATHDENPTYAQQLNKLRHRAEAAEAEITRVLTILAPANPTETLEGAVRNVMHAGQLNADLVERLESMLADARGGITP